MPVERVPDPAAVAPLFEGWPETLIRATLEGCMGCAYANPARTAAQIICGDFVFFAGDAACADAYALVAHLPPAFTAGTLLMVPRDAAWAALIRNAFGSSAVPDERYAFRRDVYCFDPAKLKGFQTTLPPGVQLHPLDGPLYRAALAENWSRDLVSQFADETDYLTRGLGFMALAGGEPVAGASSYVVCHGGLEIEIDTRADYRRQGLALACSAALIQASLQRGLYPSWDAANLASVALAEKLDYVLDHAYPIYRVTILP